MAAGGFVSDGKAVNVVAPKDIEVNEPVVAQGWFGIALSNADSGDTFAIEVEREHEFTVDPSVNAAVGDILYITSAGVIDDSSSGNRAFCKVTVAKDSNNVVAGKLLPQVTA